MGAHCGGEKFCRLCGPPQAEPVKNGAEQDSFVTFFPFGPSKGQMDHQIYSKGGGLLEKEILKLARQAARGNVSAYGSLIVHYQDYLYRMAFLHVKNEAMALDVVGDCILKGFQSIRRLKHPEYFKTWITRILIRCAADAFSKNRGEVPMDPAGEAFPAGTSGISAEEKWDLYDAIDRLPEKYKTVIILKYFSELTVREIAYAMDIPEGSVKAYLSRARKELRGHLKEGYFNAT